MSFSDDLEILFFNSCRPVLSLCKLCASYSEKSIVLTAECCYETGTLHYFNQYVVQLTS
jgi:hypothetical protein